MSFLSPTPAYINPTNSSSFSDFDFDKSYFDLLWNPEPDYDELLIHLSVFAFNQLSHDEQRQKVEEISHTLNVEDVEISKESGEASRPEAFTELLKKLSYSDQLKIFLSEVIQKFSKLGRQGTNSDEEDNTCIVKVDPDNRLDVQSNTDQQQKDTISNNRTSSDPTYSFEEFFLGFSVIWFKGQSARGQEMLTEQLKKLTKGVVIAKGEEEESMEDFKLRRFNELCMSVVNFRVQEQFLETAELKLQNWGVDCHTRLIGEDLDSGAQLLSHLWRFGVSLMSTEYQELKIDEMSTMSCCTFLMRSLSRLQSTAKDHSRETMRIKRLTDLFNQYTIPSRIALFKEMRTTSRRQKYHSHPYEEFMSGLATIWFKAKCANMQRNPVQLILFGRVEIVDTTQKQPEEGEEDYRLRRFGESFKLLDFTSQNFILDYIEDTLSRDLGYPGRRSISQSLIIKVKPHPEEEMVPNSAAMPSDGRDLYHPEWINFRPTNPRNLVAATSQAATSAES